MHRLPAIPATDSKVFRGHPGRRRLMLIVELAMELYSAKGWIPHTVNTAEKPA